MRGSRPPKLAVWMLRHFGSSPNNESVVGDLEERYRQVRSARWYWKQVIIAIVVSFFTEVWTHKLLAGGAFLICWSLKVIWLSAYAYIYGAPARRLFRGGIEAAVFVAVI